ncbi:MAG TPA: ATP-dependent helicase HrpB [Longimicrobiales bacterium]
MRLPIDDVLPEVVTTLSGHKGLVLQAPPGAGKTTRVPLALLSAGWLQDRRVIMLEPRRLAARAAAAFMARSLGENVGDTVGYRIRFDTRVSARTRVEVVTEGVLTRMLQSDPALETYGVVIFDEFHERSLHADVGLALALQSRALLRPDLRIVVMSATLHGEAVAALLGNAPVVTSTGRMYPVDTVYLPRARDVRIEAATTHAVRRALGETSGDVLVFLPGAGEIHRTLEQLQPEADAHTYVVPLYGNLTQAEQDRAIAPAPAGARKIVLATSIAETSLTIEGVRVVVDSGLMRVPRFDARIGMTRLDTITVSRASAEQRRGRAGRLARGVCYRLWAEHEDAALVPYGRPEILEADLAGLALDLAVWGVSDPDELAWLDTPPASAFAQARELLHELGALDGAHTITRHGRRMAGLPVHPRLAHMLLRAHELGHGALACDIAALLSERRLHVNFIDRAAAQTVQREAAHYRRLLHVRDDTRDFSAAGLLLAFAYPDRIGRTRGERGKYLLRNGRGAALEPTHPAAGAAFIVAAELEGSGRDSRVFLAAAISEAEIREQFADQIDSVTTVEITAAGSAQAIVRERLGAIVLKESPARATSEAELARALLADIVAQGLESLPWTKAATQLRERIVFLHGVDETWPDFSMRALADSADTWLLPQLHGLRSRSAVQTLDMHALLVGALPWTLRNQLDRLAPAHLDVPSGSQIFIDYADPAAPHAAVRLQEVFGMRETPRLAGGRVPLTLHLLSPAQRPVQVTRDLASFWKNGYFEVKKELKGRYPKHYWPDDPLTAEATRRTRPR